MAKYARVVATIMHVAADIVRYVAKSGEKFPCLKSLYYLLKIFWDFQWWKDIFLKVLKKWSSFRKKLLYFFPLLGEGGSRPKSGVHFKHFKKLYREDSHQRLHNKLLLSIFFSNLLCFDITLTIFQVGSKIKYALNGGWIWFSGSLYWIRKNHNIWDCLK